jgi:tetratricopeptide (TPR) repeat protein
MDETSFPDYVLAVSKADPENVDVHLKVVDFLQQDGKLAEVAGTLEKLFQKPGLVPFRYRETLGAFYESRGEADRAREQYLAYIDGLAKLVEQTPENLNLASLLVRFCVDKKLELDRAESVIDATMKRSPPSPSLLLTRARLHIAKAQFQEALTILEGLPVEGGNLYDLHLNRGLAYVGLNDAERARVSFEKAVAVDGARPEARKELKKLEMVPLPQ